MTITHGIQAVTPETACRWLEGNTHNRPVRDAHVEALARDMLKGHWRMTADPVRFDANGTLLDGQHRLWAIVNSGCTVPLLVVRGLDIEAQDYMDIGARRTAGDALTIDKIGASATQSRTMASVARTVLMYHDPAHRPTQSEVLSFVREHLDLLGEAVTRTNSAKGSGLRGGSVYGTAYFVLASVDYEASQEYFHALVTGEGLLPGNPILALRSRFLRTPPRAATDPSAVKVNMAYFVKAWNAWREGRRVAHIRYALDEPTPIPR